MKEWQLDSFLSIIDAIEEIEKRKEQCKNEVVKQALDNKIKHLEKQLKDINELQTSEQKQIEPQYEVVGDFKNGFAKVRLGDKWGFVNTIGKVVVEPIYDKVSDFISNAYAKVEINGKSKFLLKNGKLCDEVGDFYSGFAKIKLDNKYGFINEYGDIAIEPRYDEVGDFKAGFAKVRLGNKWGFIDENGDTIVGQIPIYDEVEDFKQLEPICYTNETVLGGSYAKIRLGNKWGFVNTSGEVVVELIYDEVGDFHYGYHSGHCHYYDEYARVKLNSKWGFVNTIGEVVVELIYDEVGDFKQIEQCWSAHKNFYAKVRLDKKWGFIITWNLVRDYGNIIVEPRYDEVRDFYYEYARVKLNGKWGFIDDYGKVIVEPQYDEAGDFESGYARIKLNGKWGFINTRGEIIVEPQYDEAGDFESGYARIKLNGKWGFINTRGEIIVEPQYDEASDIFLCGVINAKVKIDGKFKFLLENGKLCDEVRDMDGSAEIRLGDKWFYYYML